MPAAAEAKLGLEFRVRVPVTLKRSGEYFVASCNSLDVHSQGRDEGEAVRNLVEAIQLFLETCYERGTLEEALKACGFEPLHPGERPARTEGRTVDIPLPLICRDAKACAC